MFPGVYWPLIAGFIAFLLVLVALGFIVDRPRMRGGKGGHH